MCCTHTRIYFHYYHWQHFWIPNYHWRTVCVICMYTHTHTVTITSDNTCKFAILDEQYVSYACTRTHLIIRILLTTSNRCIRRNLYLRSKYWQSIYEVHWQLRIEPLVHIHVILDLDVCACIYIYIWSHWATTNIKCICSNAHQKIRI